MGIATYLVDPPFGSDLLGRVPPVDGAETSETLLVSFCVNAAKEEEHGFEKRNRQARRRETLTRPFRQCPSFWAPPGRSRCTAPDHLQHMGSSFAAGGALCVVPTATSSSATEGSKIAAAALAVLATRLARRSSWSFIQCFLHSSFHWTGSVCRSACDAKGCG